MPTRRILPPYRGVGTTTPYYQTPGDMCPPEAMRNARCFVPTDDRPQIGQRPGLRKRFNTLLGNGAKVQAMDTVARVPVVTGYVLGECTDLVGNWESKTAGSLLGQVWLLRKNLAMYREWYENVGASNATYGDTATTNPSTQAVNAVCVTPAGDRVIFASNYVDGSGVLVSRITCIRTNDAAFVWSHKITRSGAAFVNALAADNNFVYVATNNYVRVIQVSNGFSPPRQEHDLNRWASEVVDVKVSADGQHLYALFVGTDQGYTLPAPSSIAVTSGQYSQHFFSGVMKFAIDATDALPLSITAYGPVRAETTNPNNALYGGGRSFNRFSIVFDAIPNDGIPRGCIPTAMAVTPDNGIVVTHTNRGWGYNSTATPTGYAMNNVTLFDETGNIIWRANTHPEYSSIGDGSAINDIVEWNSGSASIVPLTSTGQPFALLNAVAAAANGDIYVGGRRSGGSGSEATVFRLAADDGRTLARFDTGHNSSSGQTVRSMAMDPLDGSVFVGGDRSSSWTGASSRPAHLWKLSPADLAVLGFFDLAASGKSALGVAVDRNGQIAYVTDKV